MLHPLLPDLRAERAIENQPHSVEQGVHLPRPTLSARLHHSPGLAADLPLYPTDGNLLEPHRGALLADGQHRHVVHNLRANLALPRDSDRLAAGLAQHRGQAPGEAAAGQAPAGRGEAGRPEHVLDQRLQHRLQNTQQQQQPVASEPQRVHEGELQVLVQFKMLV